MAKAIETSAKGAKGGKRVIVPNAEKGKNQKPGDYPVYPGAAMVKNDRGTGYTQKSAAVYHTLLQPMADYKAAHNGQTMPVSEQERLFPSVFPAIVTRSTSPRRIKAAKAAGREIVIRKAGDPLPDGESPAWRWWNKFRDSAKLGAAVERVAEASGISTTRTTAETEADAEEIELL